MNVTELTARVYRDLAEAAVQNDRISAEAVLDALNQAYVQVARESWCFRRETSFPTEEGEALYTLPEDVFELRVARCLQGGSDARLTFISMDELDDLYPRWRSADAGMPRYCYRYDARYCGLYPAPSAVGTLILEGHIVPVSQTSSAGQVAFLAAAADAPELPEPYHALLVHGAVAILLTTLAFDMEGASARAQLAQAQFYTLLSRLRSEVV
jgi:hypothetical protein